MIRELRWQRSRQGSENGYWVKVIVTEYDSDRMDTQEDLNRVEEMLRNER